MIIHCLLALGGTLCYLYRDLRYLPVCSYACTRGIARHTCKQIYDHSCPNGSHGGALFFNNQNL